MIDTKNLKRLPTRERLIAMISAQAAEAFQSHEVAILRNDGLNRHYECFRPGGGGGAYWFGVVTWKNYLCIYGDCGHYVFSRTDDMLAFIGERSDFAYLAEKCEAYDRAGGARVKRNEIAPRRMLFCIMAVQWLWRRLALSGGAPE